MKTKKTVLAENSEFKTLINAVISKVGLDSVNHINSYGIGGGFCGFVYYSDTHKFAMKHRKLIIWMLESEAGSFGQEVIEMVSNFGVFRTSKMDNEDRKELYRYIGGGKCEQSTITNLMAWYAAETVCRMFEN